MIGNLQVWSSTQVQPSAKSVLATKPVTSNQVSLPARR